MEKIVGVESTIGLISATSYVASPDVTKSELTPYLWCKDFVVAGAVEHGLSREHIDAIRAVVAVDDPNEARAAENRQILSPSKLIDLQPWP